MSTLRNYANPYLRNKARKKFGFDYAFIDKEELKALREEEAKLKTKSSPSKVETVYKGKDLINPDRVNKTATKVTQVKEDAASGRVADSLARVNKSVQANSSRPQRGPSVNQMIQPQKCWRKVSMDRFSCSDMSSRIKKYLMTQFNIKTSHVIYSRSFRWEVVCGPQTIIIVRCEVFNITDVNGNSSIFLCIEGDNKVSDPIIQNALARVRNEYPNGYSYYQRCSIN